MYAFLVLGIVVVTVLVGIFAGGALVGLVSLALLALRALRRPRGVQAQTVGPASAAPRAGRPRAVNAETFDDLQPAYAAA